MKHKRLKTQAMTILLLCLGILSGCSVPSYEGYTAPEQKPSELSAKQQAGYYIERDFSKTVPVKEDVLQQWESEDGLCRIEKKKSYYEVTLNYEKGTPKQVGTAYASMILKACPNYRELLEHYLFENIRLAFSGSANPELLKERLLTLKNSLPESYQQEMDGFAEIMANSENGIAEDGKISYEEVILGEMVPDALRPTACSSISVSGKKTESGHRLVSRNLEWTLGSSKQICQIHCVTHAINANSSYTAVGALGMMNILTAVNDDGVMIGEFDVSSIDKTPFVTQGRTCYSYALRYALENYTTARDASEYLVGQSGRFTFNCNALVADDKESLCVELVVDDADGKAIVRDSSTPLHEGLQWDDPECFCIVNSFAAKGNADMLTTDNINLVRWNKYNLLFCGEKEPISLSRFEELLTCEKTKNSPVVNFRGNELVHTVVVDFSTRKITAILTQSDSVSDEIQWIDLGNY